MNKLKSFFFLLILHLALPLILLAFCPFIVLIFKVRNYFLVKPGFADISKVLNGINLKDCTRTDMYVLYSGFLRGGGGVVESECPHLKQSNSKLVMECRISPDVLKGLRFGNKMVMSEITKAQARTLFRLITKVFDEVDITYENKNTTTGETVGIPKSINSKNNLERFFQVSASKRREGPIAYLCWFLQIFEENSFNWCCNTHRVTRDELSFSDFLLIHEYLEINMIISPKKPRRKANLNLSPSRAS